MGFRYSPWDFKADDLVRFSSLPGFILTQGTPKVWFGRGGWFEGSVCLPRVVGGKELPAPAPLLLRGQCSPSEGTFWGRRVTK